MKGAQVMFWKRSKLTKREERIRSYLIDEHYKRLVCAAIAPTQYEKGQLDEAAEILGKALDILGG